MSGDLQQFYKLKGYKVVSPEKTNVMKILFPSKQIETETLNVKSMSESPSTMDQTTPGDIVGSGGIGVNNNFVEVDDVLLVNDPLNLGVELNNELSETDDISTNPSWFDFTTENNQEFEVEEKTVQTPIIPKSANGKVLWTREVQPEVVVDDQPSSTTATDTPIVSQTLSPVPVEENKSEIASSPAVELTTTKEEASTTVKVDIIAIADTTTEKQPETTTFAHIPAVDLEPSDEKNTTGESSAPKLVEIIVIEETLGETKDDAKKDQTENEASNLENEGDVAVGSVMRESSGAPSSANENDEAQRTTTDGKTTVAEQASETSTQAAKSVEITTKIETTVQIETTNSPVSVQENVQTTIAGEVSSSSTSTTVSTLVNVSEESTTEPKSTSSSTTEAAVTEPTIVKDETVGNAQVESTDVPAEETKTVADETTPTTAQVSISTELPSTSTELPSTSTESTSKPDSTTQTEEVPTSTTESVISSTTSAPTTTTISIPTTTTVKPTSKPQQKKKPTTAKPSQDISDSPLMASFPAGGQPPHPLLARILLNVQKPLQMPLFMQRNKNAFISPLLKIASPVFRRKKSVKREAKEEDIFVTPRPFDVICDTTERATKRPNLLERYHSMSSGEKADKLSKVLEKFMHGVKIASHVDGYLASRAKDSIKKIHRLFAASDEEN